MVHLFKADNASAAEEMLHAYFHNKRMEGEWFRLSKDEQDVLLKVTEFREGRFVVGKAHGGVKDLFRGKE